VTATVVAACFTTGLIAGWLVRTALVMAEVARSQERMQTKIRYWQSEAVHARHRAERLTCRLRALECPTDDLDDELRRDED
jgi:uncharacterized membrane protein YciS (DUF1049 family)